MTRATDPSSADAVPPQPSDVMQLKEGNRISIPAVVLRAAGWPQNAPMKIIAELMEPGRVRLHTHAEIEQKLEQLRNQLVGEGEDDEESIEKMSVLGDRYRNLSLERSGRVRLTEAVLLHLGVAPGEYPYLLIRTFGKRVEILSRAERDKRNQQLRLETTP